MCADSTVLNAYDICKERFNSKKAADIYRTRHVTSRKGKRERRCIQRALSNVNADSSILDLPCGTGRLSYFLHELGYQVVAADYSTHMLEHAKNEMPLAKPLIRFEQQDITAIQYPDNTFAATVCNRLFHHYPSATLRQTALKELARVTQGPIVVSFFNSFSLSALLKKLKHKLKGKKSTNRMGISLNEFKRDIEACGLKIEKIYYTLRGISQQTYVKLIRQP